MRYFSWSLTAILPQNCQCLKCTALICEMSFLWCVELHCLEESHCAKTWQSVKSSGVKLLFLVNVTMYLTFMQLHLSSASLKKIALLFIYFKACTKGYGVNSCLTPQ